MPQDPLNRFLTAFRSSFRPPTPKSRPGRWLISGVWSDYMRGWLDRTFAHHEFEHPPRLDAALWFDRHAGHMDIALEWEWDDAKVHDEFPVGDFPKVLTVDAACGLAIIQTRADGRDGGRDQRRATQTMALIRQSHTEKKIDDRPVGVIEIRRAFQDDSRVDFVWTFHDLNRQTTSEGVKWSFPTATPSTEVRRSNPPTSPPPSSPSAPGP